MALLYVDMNEASVVGLNAANVSLSIVLQHLHVHDAHI